MYLTKDEINNLLNTEIFIRPLLDNNQISEVSVDLRIGGDFLVSIQGRNAFINASQNDAKMGEIGGFFQETRRKFGETFLLHPHQTVLASSLEYIKLPNNIFGILTMRSTYSRLGLTLSSIIQPGYCGCISLELTNTSNNSINLTVGAAIFQIQFVRLENDQNYFGRARKYICQVRPCVPAIAKDKELDILNTIWKLDNNIN